MIAFASTDIAMRIHELVQSVARRPGNRSVLSTGEFLAVAVVLDKPQWLKEARMSMLDAIDRLGPDWAAAALQVQRAFGSNPKGYLQ